MNMVVTPTEGNKEALMTTSITRRSGDKDRCRKTAEAGVDYIKNELLRDIINRVEKEEAKKIIAETIISEHKVNTLEIDEDNVINIQSNESILDVSGNTGMITTQLTRDKLAEAQERIRELTVQLAEQNCAAQAPDSMRGESHTNTAVTPEQARMAGKDRNTPAGRGC